MQIKVVSLPSDPPSSPSPDPTDKPNPVVSYSFRFEQFLFILLIVFLVFISCKYIWRKLIVKLIDYPTAATFSSPTVRGAGGSSMNLGIVGRTSPELHALPPQRPSSVNVCSESRRRAGEPSMHSECVICLKEFRYRDLCRVLPECNHTFHAPCIDGWIVIKRSCPTCRSPIQPF